MRLHRRLQEYRDPLFGALGAGTPGRGTWRDPFRCGSGATWVDAPGWTRIAVSPENKGFIPDIPELIVVAVDTGGHSVYVHPLAVLGIPGAVVGDTHDYADQARRRILMRRLRAVARTARGYAALEAARATGGLPAVERRRAGARPPPRQREALRAIVRAGHLRLRAVRDALTVGGLAVAEDVLAKLAV